MTESIPPQIPAYESPEKPPSTPVLTIMEQVLFHPSVETFSRLLPEASIYRALLWLLVLSLFGGVTTAILYPVQSQASRQIAQQFLGEDLSSLYQQQTPLWTMACIIPINVIGLIIGIFITVGLYFVIARLLGGVGDYTETFFLFSAAYIVIGFIGYFLTIISTVLALIPTVGIYLQLLMLLPFFAFSIYSSVLAAFSLAAAQRFTFGKGCITVIIPFILTFLCICCFIFGLTSLFGSLFSASQGLTP
jgi:hypothetical protein